MENKHHIPEMNSTCTIICTNYITTNIKKYVMAKFRLNFHEHLLNILQKYDLCPNFLTIYDLY